MTQMSELIDRDALLKKCIEGDGNDEFTEGYNFAVQEISAYITLAPTIEAEPVRHGRWIRHKITCSSRCSECKKYTTAETPRCPYCGARMDGGADNTDN